MTAAVATAVRVIGGIHNYAADCRPNPHAAFAPGLSDLNILVLFITNYTDSRHAVGVD
jgi:hypothetical protein